MTKEKRAVIVASFTAMLLIFVKAIAWILTWSMAMLTSAIDSTLDFFVSLMNFFAIRKSEQPHDEDHNYGHGKIEWFWALFEWIIILISWLLIIYFSIMKIAKWAVLEKAWESISFMVFSIIVTFLLVSYLEKVAKNTDSLVIKADSLHYKSDLYTNMWIIISLIAIKVTGFSVIDPAISIVIAFYIMHWAFNIISEWMDMLMDKVIEPEYVSFIKDTILSFEPIDSYHFLKTRKSWRNYFIEFHIVFKNALISLKEAHIIWDQVETKIIERIPNSTVMIHLDYCDDSKI